jgi:hypothetical protein
MFNWLALRSGQWRPSCRVVEIILKHDLLGLSVEALPGATPHPLMGRRWEDIEAQIGLPRIAGTGAVWNTQPSPLEENTKGMSSVVA